MQNRLLMTPVCVLAAQTVSVFIKKMEPERMLAWYQEKSGDLAEAP